MKTSSPLKFIAKHLLIGSIIGFAAFQPYGLVHAVENHVITSQYVRPDSSLPQIIEKSCLSMNVAPEDMQRCIHLFQNVALISNVTGINDLWCQTNKKIAKDAGMENDCRAYLSDQLHIDSWKSKYLAMPQ